MTSTGRSRSPQCLDAGQLAAFVDGRGSEAERAIVEAHLATCEACYEALVEVTSTLGDIEERRAGGAAPARSSGSGVRRGFLAGLATAAAVILAAGVWWWQRPTPLETALAALADAPRNARFSPGRVSVDREWRPEAEVLRSGTVDGPSLDVRSSALALTSLTTSDPSGSSLHARGIAQLAVGDVAGALEALEAAVAARDVDVATVRADLSAAQLERFRRTGDRAAAVRALEDADLALRIAPGAAPALFNRAVALEALGDRDQAAVAWRLYLDADPSSAWSTEARRRLAR